MKRSDIKAQSRKIVHGAWVGDIPGAGDLKLKVRARFNPDYKRRQREMFDAEAAENKPDGVLKPEIAEAHDRQLMLDCVLVDWSGYVEDDGAAIAFSREEAAAMLLDPDEVAFQSFVNYAAMMVADRGELELKAAEGN